MELKTSLSFAKSAEWVNRAKDVIPGCSQTFSKSKDQFPEGASPLFIRRGKGATVEDVDGNTYIDYAMALGPAILGYNHPAVTSAVEQQLNDGTLFTLPHPLEVEVAEKLTTLIPGAEMVRFGKNGSDVTAGAIRAARAYTGRERVACCGYHGWQDWYVGTTTRARGVPRAVRDLTSTFQYNNIASLEKIFDDHPNEVAAVILEPMGLDAPQSDFLEKVRDLTHRHGALLIFDEVVTGFRWSLGGAQAYFKVTPDLSCFGKAMANGFPLSCVVGKKDVMKIFEEIFFSFTFGGETLSLAACLATLNFMEKNNVLARIWSQGDVLLNGCKGLITELGLEKTVRVHGVACRFVWEFLTDSQEPHLEAKTLFQQEAIQRGVLYGPGHNISYAHGATEIEQTIAAYRGALAVVKQAFDARNFSPFLKGKTVVPVFRKA